MVEWMHIIYSVFIRSFELSWIIDRAKWAPSLSIYLPVWMSDDCQDMWSQRTWNKVTSMYARMFKTPFRYEMAAVL